MKHLFPKITVLMTVHMKAESLESAIESVLAQTRQDFQFIIADSGLWQGREHLDQRCHEMRKIYYKYVNHPKVEWIFTGEKADDYLNACMVSKVTNAILREDDLVRGEYLCTFYDDDLYEPEFIEKMAGFLDGNADFDAVRCSQRRVEIRPDGSEVETGTFTADRDIPQGENMDCVVDGMQVMMRMSTIRDIGYPYLPEEESTCSHSDGIFFNRFGAKMRKMGHINEVLCTHRATPVSTYSPTAEKKRLI